MDYTTGGTLATFLLGLFVAGGVVFVLESKGIILFDIAKKKIKSIGKKTTGGGEDIPNEDPNVIVYPTIEHPAN